MNANEATIKAAAILPVLDDMSAMMQDLLAENEAQRVKIAGLEQEKVTLEKVASVHKPFAFDEQKVASTIQRLRDMNILDDALAIKVAADLKRDPSSILDLTTRISEAIISTVPGEGAGIAKEASTSEGGIPGDPDGWYRMAPKRVG